MGIKKYEAQQTSKEQTKMPRFMLEVPRPCTTFCFSISHVTNCKRLLIVLVHQYGANNDCVLCTVKAKKENKNIHIRTLSSFITSPLY